MTALKSILVVALAGYLGLLAIMYVAQRALMYFPDTARIAPADAGFPQAAEVMLRSADGTNVIAWHVPPKEGRPVVIYFHGNGGSLRYRVAALSAADRGRYRPCRLVLSRVRRLARIAQRSGADRGCARGL